MTIFYIPIITYIAFLCVRYKGFTALSSNPGIKMSGLIGENKASTLAQLQDSDVSTDFVAAFSVISVKANLAERMIAAQKFMSARQLDYPIILKPDFGQRGLGVAVIRDTAAMEQYLSTINGDVLIQQHIEGEEFGVFYIRLPNETEGSIFSITEKQFPILRGDGVSNVEQLILENKRTHYMARYLLGLHINKLQQVLEEGEIFKTVEIGSHCRGSLFLDGEQFITPELTKIINEVSYQVKGFYFGRYDIRAESAESFKQGKNFKVLEVNGLTSESTNIYDPKHSVFFAYKTLFKQWRIAFEIGKQNIDAGKDKVTLGGLLQHLRLTYG